MECVRTVGDRRLVLETGDIARARTEAVLTTGGRLPARHVIHAVGPRGGDPDADRLLGSAVRSALRVAEEHGLHSIAFPAISTGIFGYPLPECARRMSRIALEWLAEPAHGVTEIRIVLFDEFAYRVFERALEAPEHDTRTS